MLRMAGRSSGLSPTASAIEKSSVSTGGRPRSMWAANTTRTSTSIAVGQQVAEVSEAAIELGFRCRRARRPAMAPNAVRETGVDDQAPRGSAAHVGAEEHAVGALRERRDSATTPGALLDRKALTGERRLADEEVGGVEQNSVARDQAAGCQQDHISRHDRQRRRARSTRPSRTTLARTWTRARNACAAVSALYSRTNPMTTVVTTITSTMPASNHSCVSPEAIAAKTSNSSSGLRSWLAKHVEPGPRPRVVQRVGTVAGQAQRPPLAPTARSATIAAAPPRGRWARTSRQAPGRPTRAPTPS